MSKPYATWLGKAVKYAASLRGGGSALPGLVVEKIDPDFVGRTLAQLPHGVVVVSGSNGKTTTTKMVVELLEGQGLKVFTNRTGSNFTRGVAAALLGEIDNRGNLTADIAVLELDEAHGVRFVESIHPNYVLILNVMRDQLDRFGEIDTVARLVAKIARQAQKGVVLNRDDPRLANLSLSVPIHTFGTHPDLKGLFPSDDDLHGRGSESVLESSRRTKHDTSLEKLEGQRAVFAYSGKRVSVDLKINGIYNVLNATAAIALCRMIMDNNFDEGKMIETLKLITPAFGRGECFEVNGHPLEIVLVKNPAGFRLSLASFPSEGYATMIAINDNYADGRDMSWLWDVNFSSLTKNGVGMVSGIRAFDMALRLQYDEVPVADVNTNLSKALREFIDNNTDSPKRIYCTYTAMLSVRREIGKLTGTEASLT